MEDPTARNVKRFTAQKQEEGEGEDMGKHCDFWGFAGLVTETKKWSESVRFVLGLDFSLLFLYFTFFL